ncbi:MAG TPA: hypothetical protein VGG89_14150 [Candidatus Baltobacteraceae bacterium]
MVRNYIAVVFNQSKTARRALHELWRLRHDSLLTVHGAGVVYRKSDDEIVVDVDDSSVPFATGLAIVVGALLGALAGPAGAAVGAAGGAAIGGAGGAVAGSIIDIGGQRTQKQALNEAGLVLPSEHYALIADVAESDPHPLTQTMHSLGGKLYRRARSEVDSDGIDNMFQALKPYRYDPVAAAERKS